VVIIGVRLIISITMADKSADKSMNQCFECNGEIGVFEHDNVVFDCNHRVCINSCRKIYRSQNKEMSYQYTAESASSYKFCPICEKDKIASAVLNETPQFAHI